MSLKQLFTVALVGFSSLASAAPSSVGRDVMPAEKGLKHRSRLQQKRSPLIIQQTIVEPQVIIVEQNLGAINQLAQIAEQELAALVQSQVALVNQLEIVKNNIRVNHFKARNTQVNTVIVTVTDVIDARDPQNINKRYLMNQLVADNGFPDKQVVVMMTQQGEMTIAATPTLDLSGILGTAAASAASIVGAATGVPKVAGFDPNAPFGTLNQSLILPYNTSAPAAAGNAAILVVDDPANIIFANQNNLFVESLNTLQTDCAQINANQALLDAAVLGQVFNSIQAATAAQLAGLNLGTATPIIPPSVLANNPQLASQATAQQQAAQQATAQQQAAAQQQQQQQQASASSTAEAAATPAPAPAPEG
ncbi:hypothetical protein QBC46DRAFT_138648 [Diplogelasinospora grovesii]|uniref:Uncharacterized protein n=1 Tax=Diplogelasinospora grovesii TaxID=303347 RepID=A0AAN6N675_9PEZI|nr:hypothetical protein QBC46DRAFT_138648 [Diplogelasinospora grovesii]